jgi:hypothetical protein
MARKVESALIPNYNLSIERNSGVYSRYCKRESKKVKKREEEKQERECSMIACQLPLPHSQRHKTHPRRFPPYSFHFHVEPCYLSACRFPKPSGDDILAL